MPNEQKVDLIILHQVLHFFADPGQVLKSAASRLEKGGRMLVVDFAPHELEFLRERDAHRRLGLSQQQMTLWAGAAGMEIDVYENYENAQENQSLTVCIWMLSRH